MSSTWLDKCHEAKAFIGNYQVHYVDGSQETIPIVCGKDVRDWWSNDTSPVTLGQVVWVGRNKAVTAKGRDHYLRLYMTVWENPYSEKTVASLDYVSAMTKAGPFCVAITVEMPSPGQASPAPPSASEPGLGL